MVHVRRSKTDPKGVGQRVAVISGKSIKPVGHVERWLRASEIRQGFVFQTLLRGGVTRKPPKGSIAHNPTASGQIAVPFQRLTQRKGCHE